MQQGTGFLQSDVPCPQERRQITCDNQPKTTQSVCANASFHHDNPEGCEPTHPAGGLDRVCGQRGGSGADCMANVRSATGRNLSSATFVLLENSWRPSTRRQYQAVWKEWSRNCQNGSMDRTSICVESMLGYLQYLFDKGFAWRSIGVHRSALSSILKAHKPVPVGKHLLVCRFFRGVFNKRPPSARVVPT